MKSFKAPIFCTNTAMNLLAILFSVLVLSSVSSAYAQEPIVLEQISPSGQILVKLEWPELYPDELKTFKVSFYDPNTGKLLDHKLNYNIAVSQHDHPVEIYEHNMATDGTGEFEVLFPEESQGPAKVTVEIRAIDGDSVWYEETVEFEVTVVPEFGVIAAMIMAAAFVPILFVSKSKLKLQSIC